MTMYSAGRMATFGFSLVFVNDGSPVCMEFLQRYFVDLCHRTTDRIRFIFFSDIDKEEFENDVRREMERGNMRWNMSPLQIILEMFPWIGDFLKIFFWTQHLCYIV